MACFTKASASSGASLSQPASPTTSHTAAILVSHSGGHPFSSTAWASATATWPIRTSRSSTAYETESITSDSCIRRSSVNCCPCQSEKTFAKHAETSCSKAAKPVGDNSFNAHRSSASSSAANSSTPVRSAHAATASKNTFRRIPKVSDRLVSATARVSTSDFTAPSSAPGWRFSQLSRSAWMIPRCSAASMRPPSLENDPRTLPSSNEENSSASSYDLFASAVVALSMRAWTAKARLKASSKETTAAGRASPAFAAAARTKACHKPLSAIFCRTNSNDNSASVSGASD
mmetsp:Transcript_65085/g.155419  ORF Transcript_65085/g.155419 Transcript_65085/m.155419 type:complete len:289 (-) Transcript_65085:44-910(-)